MIRFTRQRVKKTRSDTFRCSFESSLRRVVQIYEVRSLSHEPPCVRLLLAALITLPSLCFHSVRLIQVVRRRLAHISPALLSAPIKLSERSKAYETDIPGSPDDPRSIEIADI